MNVQWRAAVARNGPGKAIRARESGGADAVTGVSARGPAVLYRTTTNLARPAQWSVDRLQVHRPGIARAVGAPGREPRRRRLPGADPPGRGPPPGCCPA